MRIFRYRRPFGLYVALAFSAGVLVSGLFFYRHGSVRPGEFDTRDAGETVRQFTEELALYAALAFSAGALVSGLYFYRRGSLRLRELDARHAAGLRAAEETIGRLTEELRRERSLTGELRKHNNATLRAAAPAALSGGMVVEKPGVRGV
jgi:sulfur relay (sulfurtransferase) DsrF/TusC family protein